MRRSLNARVSLHARLLLVAALTSLLALGFAAWSIGNVLERFVLRGLDESLDTQIAVLTRAVGPDGSFDRARLVELPGFRRQHRGWAWRVRSPAGLWWSGEQISAEHFPPAPRRHGRGRRWVDPYRAGDGVASGGTRLHLRQSIYAIPAGRVEITTGAPEWIVDRPIRAALPPLLISLALLAAGLAVSTWIQLRFGLRPLRALSAAVAQVRSGTRERLPLDHPAELRPLAQEVNALIDQNEAGLTHARRHLANLAHGLKTPLATLSLQLERENASAESRALVAQLDKRIAHHLRRARSAAPGASVRTRTTLGEVLPDLVDTLRRVHLDRALAFDVAYDPALSVAVDRQDLDEVFGNLLDNACRHARAAIRVSSRQNGASVTILIEDDGDGLPPDQVEQALRPGQRLDESGVGYGFGLAIVRELVDLYGGALDLRRSDALGGLLAAVDLPASVQHRD